MSEAASQDDRTMGMLAHLSALISVGPLIIWLMNKDKPDKAFVTENAKEALNFVITIWGVMIGLSIVLMILAFIPVLGVVIGLLGSLLLAAAGIGALVLIVIAGMKANEGISYRYPFAIRLIK